MPRPTRPLLSSISTKTVMALTGLGLLGFVIAHMLGNLQVFAGREKLNAYAKTLQDLGPLLWVMRGGLLALFVTHVACALRVTMWNKAARPQPYVSAKPQRSTYAGRTMLMSGLIVTAFVVYHLLHLTLGVTHPRLAFLKHGFGTAVAAVILLGNCAIPLSIATGMIPCGGCGAR